MFNSRFKNKINSIFNKFTKNPNSTNVIIIAIITLIAFSLRIYNLDAESFWRDEAFSWQTYKGSFIDVWNISKYDTHPPLYNVLMYLWTNIVGNTAYTNRLFSAICGTLLIPVLYLFTLSQTKSTRIAIIASIFATVNPQLIVYSQEARSNPLLNLVTISFFYVLTLKTKITSIILVTIISILGLHTHILFIVPFFGGLLWKWLYLSRNRLTFIQNLGILFVSLLSFIPYLLYRVSNPEDAKNFWLRFDPIKDFVFGDQFISLFTSQSNILNIRLWSILVFMVIMCIVLLLIVGVFAEYKNNRIRLLFIPLFILISLYLISFRNPIYNARYIQYSIAFLVIIAAIGSDYIFKKSRLLFSTIFISYIIASASLFLFTIRDHTSNKDYIQVVNQLKQSGDNNIFHSEPDFTYDPVDFYSTQVGYKANNYILTFAGTTKKGFQDGYIKKANRIGDLSSFTQFTIISENNQTSAKDFVESQSFCLKDAEKIAGVSIERYIKCTP